jgi:integrative and conjugative element protein (TIGR02256 family)
MTRSAVRIVVASSVADLIAQHANQAAPKETGGLLLGWWEGTTVVVGHAVEVPDPEATSSTWTRHQDAAQAALDAALRDLGHPWLGYVGDWHSHPARLSASPVDELCLRRASREYAQPLTLLVYQVDGRLGARVAYQGRIRVAQLDVKRPQAAFEAARYS